MALERVGNVGDLLALHKNSSKKAVIYSSTSITYEELYRQCKEAARLLSQEQFGNRVIGVYCPNSIAYIQAYFSIVYAGSVVVPIDTSSSSDEVCNIVNYCEVDCIVTAGDYIPELEDKLSGKTISIFDVNQCSWHRQYPLPTPSEDVSYLIANDVLVMLGTSGTTSRQKRVMLTHSGVLANIRSNIDNLNLTHEDRCLVVLQMFFGYCHTSQLLSHIAVGGTLIVGEPVFMPQAFLKAIEKHRVTNSTIVPSLLIGLGKFRSHGQFDISSLRFLAFGGSVSSREMVSALEQKYPTVQFVHTYGQTEASPRLTSYIPKRCNYGKPGSVGKPINNVRIKIVDNEGEELPPNSDGRIIATGPNLMLGYFKNQQATEATLIDGWLHTGDIGYKDEEGFLYISGREKNIIISGGLNIYPEDIEEVIKLHEQVDKVVVVPEPHKYLGEVPSANIVAKTGTDPDTLLKGVEALCRTKLNRNKVPFSYNLVNELPTTHSGKIIRYRDDV